MPFYLGITLKDNLYVMEKLMNLRYTMFIINYQIITPYHHSLHRMNNQSLYTQRETNDPFLMITISKYTTTT